MAEQMLKPHYSESTLPTLEHVVSEIGQSPCLHCTIIFHPQVARIGERAIFNGDSSEWVLGRHWPNFATVGDAGFGGPLDDPYISRRALQLLPAEDGVMLERPAQASRCRVNGMDLQEVVHIDGVSLSRGVPLLLSHSVVLLLRLSHVQTLPVCDSAGSALVGESHAMHALREQIRRAAASDQDVLIRGETGVGKELVAQAVCAGSRRAADPLVAVNMAAIPPALAAAFLFGNTRGAFSGAERARPGYFREADGGTLFLDEVGDTPEEVQPLLLRALQQREIQVVGGDTATVDVRVISATDAAIDRSECDFKSALRHRLGALEIAIPPLRERAEDIGLLLLHSLRRACDEERCADFLPHPGSSALQLAHWASLFYRFAAYDWPGNVRQLENYATQVAINSEQLPVIPPAVLAAFVPDKKMAGEEVNEDFEAGSPPRRMSEVSEREFDDSMANHGYEVRPVAEALGVSRQSVYRRIDKSTVYRRVNEISKPELEETLNACAGDIRRCAELLKVSASALRTRVRAAESTVGL